MDGIPPHHEPAMTDLNDFTTASGIPVNDNQNSITAGQRGPVLLQDVHLIEKLQHFNRERIPERVVHARARAPMEPSPSPMTSAS